MNLNWKIYEKIGSHIYNIDYKLIINFDDLKIGDKIKVPFVSGFIEMTIYKNENEFYASSKNYISILEFDEEDKYWISGGIVNKKCLANQQY